MDTYPVSETLCSFGIRIPDDGQSPETIISYEEYGLLGCYAVWLL
jgi:hypothetical protein